MLLPKAVASPHRVQLELDTPGAIYAPGSPISGRLVLEGVAPDAGELRVEIHGHAKGPHGQTSIDVLASELVYSGPWEPGVQNTFRFSIEAPRCVSRYQGQLFQLHTRLAAVTLLESQGRYKEGARRKPAAHQPVAISYDSRPLCVAPETVDLGTNPEGCAVSCNLGCAIVGGATLGALALVLKGVLPGFLPDLGFDAGILYWIVAGLALLMFAIGSFGVINGIRAKAIHRAVGHTELRISSAPQSGVALAIDLQLNRLNRVKRGEAILSIREDTRTYKGRDRHGSARYERNRHVLARHNIELALHPADQRLSGRLSQAAVAAMPPPFGSPGAKITWHLETKIHLDGSPDLTHDMHLSAAPGGEPLASMHDAATTGTAELHIGT